jgi:arylsulfatase A-like enzyme/Flp pilus assembly protein TadD
MPTFRCLLVLTLFFSLAACRREEPHDSESVHFEGAPVIIISIDTLRADRLPAYGHRGVSTPAIDAFRRDAVLYRNAYSHCPMTLPSHVSLLTGTLPYEHGVRNNLGYTFDGAAHDSIPAMLRRSGYSSGAAVSAWVLRGETGLGSVFDFYDDRVAGATNVSIAEVAREGNATVDASRSWIAAHARKPFFFLLHIFEPHAPYDAPEPFRSAVADPYDAEIAASDAIVGTFLDQLKSAGIYDRALIILLSDHGEGLGDHGEAEHGVFLYREVIRVPLLVKLPHRQRAGATIDAPVQLIDVAPTIAAITGARPRTPLPGTSLLGPIDPNRRIYGETMLPRIHFGWSGLRSLIDARHHFIEAPRVELYDVANDPRETKNIAAEERRTLSDLRGAMRAHPADVAAPSNVSPEEAEKLAALGYIGQTRETPAGELADPKDRIAEIEKLREGSALERAGDLPGAIAAYEAVLARNPQFADAWFRLAVAREHAGDLEGAAAAYRKGIDAAPRLAAQIAVALAALDLRLGRLDDAESHASLALRVQPGLARHLLGRIALARGDLASAEREARRTREEPLVRDAGSVLLAQIYVRNGRFAEALQLLDETHRDARAPVPDLEATRGDVLARMQHPDEAVAAFRRAITQFPQSADAYANLAILYAATNRLSDAEATLEAMYRAAPGPQTARLAAGVWQTLEEPERARRWEGRAAGGSR